MRGTKFLIGALLSPFIVGCAVLDNTLPVLGTVENGVYTHPVGAYSCPIPTSDQGFVGEAIIVDAAQDIKTVQRLIPRDQLRPGESSIQNVIVYPIEIIPNSFARFTDAADEEIRLDISYRQFRDRDTAEDVYASGYSGGNYDVLVEAHRVRNGREYGVGVAQLPYWVKGMVYMGFDFWEEYLNGDDPGPHLDVIFNIVIDDWHYRFLLRNSSLEFLPPDVNPKDLMAVNDALKAHPEIMEEMEERLWSLVSRCTLTPPAFTATQ